MPAKPRSEVFKRDEVGVYHCWNRLVRRRNLFGWDSLTGKDFSYRKVWVRDRYRELARGMAIDVLDYAVLDNHFYIVLRNRPDIASTWTDEEVVRRWWIVCPSRKTADGFAADPKPCDQYLTLLDTIGRVIRAGRREFIPADVRPILQRLNPDPHEWLDSILDLFLSMPQLRPSPAVIGSG